VLWEGSMRGAGGRFSASVGAWVLAGMNDPFGGGCGGHLDEPESAVAGNAAWSSSRHTASEAP